MENATIVREIPYDRSNDEASQLRRSVPDVLLLTSSFRRIAAFTGEANAADSAVLDALERAIVARIRTELRGRENSVEAYRSQFVVGGRFVRVVADAHSADLLIMVERLRKRTPCDLRAIYGLSDREMQVLELVIDAVPRARMAERLCISETTVQTHIRNIGIKMSCSRREEIIVRAFARR